MALSVKMLENKAKKALLTASNSQELEAVFKQYLGSKGELTLVLRSLAKLPKTKRASAGKAANNAKGILLATFAAQKKKLQKAVSTQSKDWLDISVPGTKLGEGQRTFSVPWALRWQRARKLRPSGTTLTL